MVVIFSAALLLGLVGFALTVAWVAALVVVAAGSGFAVANNRPGRIDLMVAMLSAALVLGLVGFALTIGWVAAMVVLAVGLGFSVAMSRRSRVEL